MTLTADIPQAEQTYSGTLAPVPPYSFEQTLAFLGGFTPGQGDQTIGGGSLTRAIHVGEQAVVARVHSTGTVEAPALAYTLAAARPLSATDRAAAEDRLRFFLSLDDDLRPFYAIAAQDPVFAPVAQQLYGLHQVKFLTPFENACWAVLTQRNRMDIARTMKDRLVERYGAAVEWEGTVYRAFPTPVALATAAPPDLFALVRNERRAEYLQAVSEAFSTVDEGWLRSAPYADVEAWLRGIRGMGPWSATFVLLRGLGRTERVPVGEGRLDQAAGRRYEGRDTPSARLLQEIADTYGPWQGYWGHYLRVAS
jgi:DNA-3-methyladenine glycosylase II